MYGFDLRKRVFGGSRFRLEIAQQCHMPTIHHFLEHHFAHMALHIYSATKGSRGMQRSVSEMIAKALFKYNVASTLSHFFSVNGMDHTQVSLRTGSTLGVGQVPVFPIASGSLGSKGVPQCLTGLSLHHYIQQINITADSTSTMWWCLRLQEVACLVSAERDLI